MPLIREHYPGLEILTATTVAAHPHQNLVTELHLLLNRKVSFATMTASAPQDWTSCSLRRKESRLEAPGSIPLVLLLLPCAHHFLRRHGTLRRHHQVPNSMVQPYCRILDIFLVCRVFFDIRSGTRNACDSGSSAGTWAWAQCTHHTCASKSPPSPSPQRPPRRSRSHQD